MVPLAPKGEHGSKAAPKDTAQPAKRDHPAEGHSSEAPITIPSAAAPAPAGIKDEPEQKPRKAHQNSHNVIVEPSVDDPDYVPPPFGNAAGAKKGKKKKKKSAMANAANPHHVKNCKYDSVVMIKFLFAVRCTISTTRQPPASRHAKSCRLFIHALLPATNALSQLKAPPEGRRTSGQSKASRTRATERRCDR